MPNNLADDLYIYSGNYLCRKYGYRYIGTIDNIRIYGKPIGYAILKAEVNDTSIHISLIVKGTELEDGVRSNQIWKSSFRTIDNKDTYLSYIDIIKNIETEIILYSPISLSINQGVRYDFEENPESIIDM